MQRTNLRAEPVGFVGREAELASLDAAMESARLVTLIGAPGAGKTRLARHYGLAHVDAYEDGVWFCDLSEARSADEVMAAVTEVVGDVRGLLILDELEHVVAGAAPVIADWLRSAPGLRVLATSRERLQLPEEVLFELGPLSLPDDATDLERSDAVRLFVERARAVRNGYRVGEHDAAHVVELMRMLDGLPLAIELAAARMRVLSPAQLVRQLGERFALLSGAAPAVARKHVTLRAALETSWNMLALWEQSALAQCSVFRGGFEIDAAVEVIDLAEHADAPGVLDVLAALRDRSLLGAYEPHTLPGELRYALLLSIRDYAAERLVESGREEAAFARHAEHYQRTCSGWAAELDGENEREARRRLALEAHNLLAMHQRATKPEKRALLAMDPVLQSRLPRATRMKLLDEALRFAGADPKAARSDDPELERAVTLAETTGDPKLVGRLLGGLGNMLAERGELERAADVYRRALVLEQRAGDRAAEARTRARLDDVLRALSDAPSTSELVVSGSGRFFQLAGGEGVSLQRRAALRRVLQRLAAERERAPGQAVSLDTLLAAGWPDQKVHPISGASRVYNALTTLRNLGLRTVLLSRDDGYLLDPSVPLRRVDDV